MSENKQTTDFAVEYLVSQPDDSTIVVTSQQDMETLMDRMLFSALQKYDMNKEMYGATFSQASSSTALTTDRISELANGANTTLTNVLEISRYVRQYINTDEILGMTFQALQNNVNTRYVLTYGGTEGRNKKKQLRQAKEAVEQFNKSIRIERLIAQSVPQTMVDGNYIMYLRTDGGNAVIDFYPLGIAEITDYTINGNPVVQINLTEFKNRLKKTYTKTKKGKALYFENVDKEIQMNFPPEVYEAHKAGETYCRLDWRRTGVLRINNMGYKYGVSHFFRSLRSAVLLEDLEATDSINNKAKGKKIIHQKLRKEVMGPNTDYVRKGFEYARYAHQELAAAWQNSTVLYTSIPAVEEVKYIEPSVEGTPTDKIAIYRNQKMTALGITYLDPEINSVSAANISLSQLMKSVDFVARQLNDILERFYAVWLEEQGIDIIYTPGVRIMDSAQMDLDMRIELARFMFSDLGASHASAMEVLGRDADDEYAKRKEENESDFADVFAPRATAYTKSGDDSDPGRPKTEDPDAVDKQDYDESYNEGNR